MFSPSQVRNEPGLQLSDLVELLVKGPLIVFGVIVAVAIIAFGYSNRQAATGGDGLSVDLLAGIITAALGLLAVSTNAIVGYLFSIEAHQKS